MEQTTATPFGARPVTSGHLARLRAYEAAATRLAGAAEPGRPHDKWALLRDLGAARAAFGVSDRDLAVLGALLGFHPGRTLDPGAPDGLVVFPSNAALGERAHGMAESTLRRHLAALTAAGLIRRQDSPNGKRYAARDAAGGLVRAFGFDLAPLAFRAAEIAAAGGAAREAALRLKRLRETATLRLRDAEKLAAYGLAAMPGAADWTALATHAAAARRAARRTLDLAATAALAAELALLLEEIRRALTAPESEETDGKAAVNERHHQNSNTEESESETRLETAVAPAAQAARPPDDGGDRWTAPFAYVAQACPDIALYARDGLRGWSDLVATAEFVRPMLGVSAEAWSEARAVLGDRAAAATLACILQSSDRIARPGGYLRALTARARDRGFTPTAMVAALAGRAGRPS